MKVYRPVCTYIWKDQRFPKLNQRAQLVWFFLFTHPLSGPIGVFRAAPAGLHQELNRNGCWTTAEFDRALHDLEREGMLKSDSENMLFGFPKFFTKERKPNHPQSPNVVRGWATYFNELPHCQLKLDCYSSLESVLEDFDRSFLKAFHDTWDDPYERHNESLQEGISEPSGKVLVNVLVPDNVLVPVSEDAVRPQSVSIDKVVALWNTMFPSRPCKHVGSTLKSRLAARVKKHQDEAWWSSYFNRVAKSSFLTGRTDRPFHATLDWVCGPKNMDKILAGNYDDLKPNSKFGTNVRSILGDGAC